MPALRCSGFGIIKRWGKIKKLQLFSCLMPLSCLQAFHYIQQMLITINAVIDHIRRREFCEQFPCAVNLRFFNRLQIQRFHRAFCLGDKEDVLHRTLVESDRPVRRVIADRSRNRESLRKFGVNADFLRQIHILSELSPHALTVFCM